MNILIDLSAIRTGGGLQLATNFLEHMHESARPADRVVLVLSDTPLLQDLAAKSPAEAAYTCPTGVLARAIFERTELRRILDMHDVEAIYTFFGAGLPHPASIVSIVTAAYPIICYPDSRFWQYLPWRASVRNRLVGAARRRRLRRADVILVETEVMRVRLGRALNMAADRFRILAPAASDYVQPLPAPAAEGGWRVLFLSDNSAHKNLWRLYEVAMILESRAPNRSEVRFLLSVSKDQYVASLRHKDIDMRLLDKYFSFLGRLGPRDIMSAYRQAHAVALLSDLESFSNNYSEAWKVGRPIVASDRDFSRCICGDSAIYVEPHDPAAVADGILTVLGDPQLAAHLVARGRDRLAQLPGTAQRCRTIWNLITENYRLPDTRGAVHDLSLD